MIRQKKRIRQRMFTSRVRELYGNQPLVGAEIGVQKGKNAVSILKVLNMKCLYLIDPYTYHIDRPILSDPHKSYYLARELLDKYPQIKWIFKPSHLAADDIHEPLDFVYIDGNHSYEFVKRDIERYCPMVKRGGLLGGHDYATSYVNGVTLAVNEKAKEFCRRLWITVEPPKMKSGDWWIQV